MKRKRRARPPMKSAIVKRPVRIHGRKTSVTLEDGFWGALKEIAASQNTRISDLIFKIDNSRSNLNLSSACRLFDLDHYRQQASTRLDRR